MYAYFCYFDLQYYDYDLIGMRQLRTKEKKSNKYFEKVEGFKVDIRFSVSFLPSDFIFLMVRKAR